MSTEKPREPNSGPIKLRVPIAPMPKPRDGRYAWRGGLNPKSGYYAWRDAFRILARQQLPKDHNEPWTCYCAVEILFRTARGMRADLDNAAGAVLDALQEVAYANDRMVSSLLAERRTDCGQDEIVVEVRRIGP